MKAEMTLDEAMAMADRYRRTTEGPYAEAFNVLCDHIVVSTQRLREATKRVEEAEQKVQALSLDLGVKENRVRPTLVPISGGKEGGSSTKAQDASVNVTGVGGTGGVF